MAMLHMVVIGFMVQAQQVYPLVIYVPVIIVDQSITVMDVGQ
jgi:hypothetical protein